MRLAPRLPSVGNLFLASFILQPARNYNSITTAKQKVIPFFLQL